MGYRLHLLATLEREILDTRAPLELDTRLDGRSKGDDPVAWSPYV